ncbi:MAG TPA: trehalase family glycosidase [Prolixibacteraceae bacterium]|nr:trehalase family glycosidase [Prolixibacteraceae bacterium]
MRKFSPILILFLAVLANTGVCQSKIDSKEFYESISQTHDVIALPAWGPYSKKYAGISHIPDVQKGMRFDVTALPGYYRNRVMVPNVLFESGYYPWDFNADLSKITYRYELEWKDKVFVDVTYSTLDSTTVLVSMKCVNNTSLPQELQLNLAGFINYPDPYANVKAICPEKIQFINAVNYNDLQFAKPRPSDHLVYDGWIRGEERNADFLLGNGIGKNFGKDRGDWVSYTLPMKEKKGILTLRYKLEENSTNTLIVSGVANKAIPLKATGKFELVQIPYQVENNETHIKLTSSGGGEIKLDGLFVGPEADSKAIQIVPQERKFTPEFTKDLKAGTLLLKYPDVDNYYGIAWDYPSSFVREILDENLDIIFRKYVHEHNYLTFDGDGNGHYINVFMRPVEAEPMKEHTVYAILCTGNKKQVEQQMAAFSKEPSNFSSREKSSDNFFAGNLESGKPYQFSQNMMRTALLSNIVYPIYTQGQFIRHFTPGKWWNSLYTWDGGFITLGLAEIDIEKSIQFLNTYTTPVGSQSAFIHHGSPVPVQMYAFYDLWNKTQSKELLNYFYPRLKQYYEFMAGHTQSSTINGFKSNLLKIWDYFYNSGGWDDYPPQKAVRDNHLESTVSPVITTAHVIRAAKILRKAAIETGNSNDVKEYDNDIKTFSNALQNIAWDKESGYFSYMVHDENGNPKAFYRDPVSGANFDMGLDGAYPIFSGICTPQQDSILLDKIFSDDHMWSQAGICVVDKQAPYYRIDGYWNGAVWMPHQWFMWKAMLDLGKTDLAWEIADKALNVWKRETDETYFTYEHWFAKNARGAGWHQFGALSDPVLIWYDAYYKPGTISTGFETWIEQQNFNTDQSGYTAALSFDEATKAHPRSMLVVMNPKFQYEIRINGKITEAKSRYKGQLEIKLPISNKPCTLEVKQI